jgi:hypothetical protein
VILNLGCVPIGYDNENNVPIKATTQDEYRKVLVQHRNVMLSQTDWRVMADSPLTQEEQQEWLDYRKYLRDLTEDLPSVLAEEFLINDPPLSGGLIVVMTPETAPR